jgi:riboflavin synthase
MGTVRKKIIRYNYDVQFVIAVQPSFPLASTDIGASIACSGCCLTVISKTNDAFIVDVSAETLSKTNLSSWNVGTKINLETSLKMGDELGGHIVTGHVDGLATLKSMTPENGSHRLQFEIPHEFQNMIAPKGSITLNGVSLTVNEVNDNQFGVNIIPHTWNVTNLGALNIGDQCHFEIDILARYVARHLGKAA